MTISIVLFVGIIALAVLIGVAIGLGAMCFLKLTDEIKKADEEYEARIKLDRGEMS